MNEKWKVDQNNDGSIYRLGIDHNARRYFYFNNTINY